MNPSIFCRCIESLSSLTVAAFFKCAGAAKGSDSKAKHRVLGYPLPAWFARSTQEGFIRILSNILQLCAGLIVVFLFFFSFSPG
jgi:predicted signal transduction protein with EAL and GGDEF domain